MALYGAGWALVAHWLVHEPVQPIPSIADIGWLTGYSSLAYLPDLPVDELKLDRAFVSPILADQRAAAIVRSTIDLAHSLGLTMVAEGIDDADTWHRLLAMGCDLGQGICSAGRSGEPTSKRCSRHRRTF